MSARPRLAPNVIAMFAEPRECIVNSRRRGRLPSKVHRLHGPYLSIGDLAVLLPGDDDDLVALEKLVRITGICPRADVERCFPDAEPGVWFEVEVLYGTVRTHDKDNQHRQSQKFVAPAIQLRRAASRGALP